MPFIEKKKLRLIYISSAVAGVAIALAGVALYFTTPRTSDYLFMAAIAVGMTPPAIAHFFDTRWRLSIESRIPELLEDIAEGQLTGLTFLRAIEASAMKDYGAVTSELRRILSHIKLGGTIEEGFEEFARRVDSRMVRRASGIMVETTRSGGDIAKIIRSLAAYLRQVETMNAERRGTMRTYVVIVYIAFAVFMTTVIILLNQFFYPLVGIGGSMFTPQADYDTYRRIFYYMAGMQALFSGLIAGKLGEGEILAGFKHAIIMIVATLVLFIGFMAG
jgi:flagellar protein FlaJ